MTPFCAADPSPFIARRERLAAQVRALGGGIVIVPTATPAMRNGPVEYPFRADSDFLYLTGFSEPEAWLVMLVGATPPTTRSILVCRPRDPQAEQWQGKRPGPEAAASALGLDAGEPIETLQTVLPQWLLDQPALFMPAFLPAAQDRLVQHARQEAASLARRGHRPPTQTHDLRALIAEMRLIKDASEVAVMREAGRISADAHCHAARAIAPGVKEYQVEAELLYRFRHQGASGPAYDSIVATGANACILHHPAGTSTLRDGQLVLIDAACEFEGYASDITRTYPVNGRYVGAQRALYDLTVAAQQAAIAQTRPGLDFNAPHEAALRVLAQGMIDEGLLAGTLDGVLESGSYRRFYMHATSHWLGLDVHDVGSYYEAGVLPGLDTAAPWRRLQAGMVLTIEPGIYVPAAEDVVDAFHDIGIRTEDDALVTAQGCELLTRGVPVDAGEIEALMRG